MHTYEQRVRTLAYKIWESEGKPNGQEYEHWERASILAAAEEARKDAETDHLLADIEEPFNPDPTPPIEPPTPAPENPPKPAHPNVPPRPGEPAQPISPNEPEPQISPTQPPQPIHPTDPVQPGNPAQPIQPLAKKAAKPSKPRATKVSATNSIGSTDKVGAAAMAQVNATATTTMPAPEIATPEMTTPDMTTLGMKTAATKKPAKPRKPKAAKNDSSINM